MPQRTVQFFTLGADRSRQAWGTVGSMPAWKRTLLLMGLVVVSLPLFLLILLMGLFLFAMAAMTIMISLVARRFRGPGRPSGRPQGPHQSDPMRQNVRVIGEHSRR